MNLESAAILLLVLVPVVGSLMCLAAQRYRPLQVVVFVTCAFLLVFSTVLLISMLTGGETAIELGSGDLGPAGAIVPLLSYLLFAVFLYIGWKIKSWFVILFAIAEVIPSILIELRMFGGESGPVILVDNLSLVLALITSMIGSLICLYSIQYMREEERRPQFFAVMLLFLGAMNGAVFSNDMLWFLLFWEVTTLCSFLLIRHTRTEEAEKAARRAIEITLGGGAALALGLLLINQFNGAITLDSIHDATGPTAVLLTVSLMVIGALTKSAQVPFQSWLVGAMVAPTPVSALLHSATMVNLGVYLLLRISPAIHSIESLSWIVGIVGAVSFVASSVLAIAQTNAKKLLAYSTIGNLGLITMCVGVGTPLAITAGLILLFYHAISKALLFLVAGVIKRQIGTENIDAMTALRDRMPFTTLALAVGIFTVVLPPFGMFASKWIISEAVVSFPILAFLLGAGFAATIVYYSKWLGVTLSSSIFGGPSVRDEKISGFYKYPVAALASGAIIASLFIGVIITYLFNPFISSDFSVTITSDSFSIFSSLGEFPVFILLLGVSLIFIVAAFLLRPGKAEETIPYMCGEEFPVETGGIYYLSERTQNRMVQSSQIIGAILIAFLLFVPVMLEVIG